MPQAATLTIALAVPLTSGAFPQPPWPPSRGISVQYEGAYSAPRLVFTTSATLVLSDFPNLIPATGAQILVVTVDAVDDTGLALTAPVTVTLTGTTHGAVVLTAGAAFAIASPGTTGGPTGISITTTAPAVVRVQAVG